MKEKKHLGGQALIEGVLIKSKDKIAMASRKGDKITVEVKNYKSLIERNKILKLPFIRGVVVLGEMLVYGMKALIWSANKQEDKETVSNKEVFLSVLFSIVAVIGIFVVAPYFLTRLFVKEQGFAFNLVDGVIRLGFFFSYLLIISRMKDIQRVFQYHGAEHMSVHCYEAEKKLTVENVRKFRTIHPRCGTSFLMFVLIISIFVFTLIRFEDWYYNVPVRLLLIPVITGISYEFIKISEKHGKIPLFKVFMLPGLWMQYITTQEPDDKQIEVAIRAVKGAL